MEREKQGYVFDIQRYTLHDGPGIRTEIFLQGCYLRCKWCHSPDSWTERGELASFQMLCSGVEQCGECLKVCPTGALSPGKIKYSKILKTDLQLVDIDRSLCTQCGACAEVCSNKALYFTAKPMCLSEIMEIILKDEKYYRKTGGGVTISGGEPMLQHEFAQEVFQECKKMGFHTALDTTGHPQWDLYEAILPFVDLVLLDLKHMDRATSQELTGVSNERILENLKKMADRNQAVQIRLPLIPGLNDSETNLNATAAYCQQMGPAIKRIQLLPYHKFGIPKYERVGKEYPLPDITPPSKETMQQCKSLFESYGLSVQIG